MHEQLTPPENPSHAGFAPHFGIDLARATNAVPDGVSSYRILLAWGVVVMLLLFVVSNLGMLTGLPGWWLVPALMVLAVTGWVVVSVGAEFVAKVRAIGRKRSRAEEREKALAGGLPGAKASAHDDLLVREEDVPRVGNVHARLRLVGKPDDIARVLAHVTPRQRFEPVIVRPAGAACFPKQEKGTDIESTTKLAVPGWKRVALFGMAALLLWGLKRTAQSIGMPRSDFGLLEIALIGAVGIAAMEWLVPTFLRIVPRRLDVMTFVPFGLGRTGKQEVIVRQYALERATIVIDLKKGAARIEDALRVRDGSRLQERIVFVRAGSLVWRNLEQEAKVWGALLSAALSHVDAPELPLDRLVD